MGTQTTVGPWHEYPEMCGACGMFTRLDGRDLPHECRGTLEDRLARIEAKLDRLLALSAEHPPAD